VVVLLVEERGVPEALIDAVSAGREGRAYVIPVSYFLLMRGHYFEHA
jgi:hypothetical protein